MEQVIIALSGRKASGKNTIAKFIADWYSESVADIYYFNERNTVFECSFADDIKNFCMNTLGLIRESCYGSDEEKNQPTQYFWEDTSAYLRWKFGTREMEYPDSSVKVCQFQDELNLTGVFYNPTHHPMGYKTGAMSGRDIMQILGTDLVRHTFGNIWAAATVRLIKRTGKPLNIITDNRFPNEIETILAEDRGYVIRLTRSPFGHEDVHPSEAALDDYDWNQDRCFTLDNANLTIEEQNQAVVPILEKIFNGRLK